MAAPVTVGVVAVLPSTLWSPSSVMAWPVSAKVAAAPKGLARVALFSVRALAAMLTPVLSASVAATT